MRTDLIRFTRDAIRPNVHQAEFSSEKISQKVLKIE